MRVPTIAPYANPSSGSHPRVSYDLEVSVRSTSWQKSITGGVSCLFPIKSSTGAEELWHDESYRYASLSSSVKRDNAHQITVSVLQFPSCSTTRIPHKRISADFNSGSGSMLNGFVRYSLGSCVYYASPPLALCVEDSNLFFPSDEITFNMEEKLMELELPVYAKDLLSDAQSRHSVFADDFVIKAFEEAEKAHRGQKRASGHPYLQHCVETALLLASIGANSTVVAAGLLHDAIDDSFVTYDHILKSFGAGVAELVQGVSKLSHLSKLARENNTANKTVEAARLHTIFLAMADARAVLIKLADRLHNMITLDALPLMKQPRVAKETSEIFVPLANRLGIFTWKEQLENLCFKHLKPYQHLELSSKLVKFFDEAVITYSVEKLDQALKGAAISYHCLSGRHKSLFSIHSKMLKKKLNMEEVHDIHGLRLIVESEEDCYKALKVVHQLWHEIPERFKDYILNPKCNGYQSLHTVVSFDGVVPLEVQIRTKEMHLQAEYGFAAHWRYKESECELSSSVVRMVEWARWVITWQCEAMSIFSDSMKPPCTFPIHSKDCRYSYMPERGSDGPVFVIIIENDKMSVQELPANSSVMDLLGCTVKDSELKLNYEDVSDPRCKLKMGDVLELTPSISHKSLLQYRQEIQRMYDKGCHHIRCNK